MAQCDDCNFYRPRVYGTGGTARTVYECRYSDPQPNGKWPEVLATDWCGKWEAIAAAREAKDGS